MRQHYIPEPRRSSELIRSCLLALAIGVGLAAALVEGLSK